jgi:hypothetical protein
VASVVLAIVCTLVVLAIACTLVVLAIACTLGCSCHDEAVASVEKRLLRGRRRRRIDARLLMERDPSSRVD